MAKSNIEKLMELKQLYENGILTKEEMESEKAKILNNDTEESENVESKVEEDQPVQEETQTISEEETYLYEEESFFEKYKTYIYVGIAVLIAIILFAVFAGSKGNVNNNVATEADDIILANLQEDSVATEIIEPIKEDNSIGKWRKEYYKDEFGETLKDEPYIAMSLNAHMASKPHDDEYIFIQYAKNSEMEYFVISNNELYYRVSPGEKDGPSVSIKKKGDVEEIEVVKRRGYAYIFDEWERRYFADLMTEGNFILKVGSNIVEIKDETKGIKNALKLLGNVEILNPAVTREDPDDNDTISIY